MANRKKTEIDRLRTMTWARWVSVRANVRTGKELELLITKKLGWQKDEASGNLGDYLIGKRSCLSTWSPQATSLWVDRAEKVWSGTSDWYRTPVWYLMEDLQYHPSQILACIELLPRQFRTLLLSESHPKTPPGLLLSELWPDRVYELCKPVSPWSLGALACAFRRAELAGQTPIYLRAGVGILWLLKKLAAAQDPWVREPLMKFHNLILARLREVVYPVSTSMQILISENQVNQFGINVQKYFDRRGGGIREQSQIDFENL